MAKKRPIAQIEHVDKARLNNPPFFYAGLNDCEEVKIVDDYGIDCGIESLRLVPLE